MAFTQNDLQTLLDDHAQEGLYLEFKRGAALDKTSEKRNELIKDCTGFANAAGGMIIYGIAEQDINGVSAAATLSPVTNTDIDRNWITEILRSNTNPPLSRFEITEIALPRDEGRVVIIEVDASSTAHQSLSDFRYYQRVGAVTSPMVDFQIRDVMNRRSRPAIHIDFRMNRHQISSEIHRYFLEATINNIGPITLEKWWLEIDLPSSVVRDTRNPHFNATIAQLNYSSLVRTSNHPDWGPITRIAFGDPTWHGHPRVLHPGQSLEFESRHGAFPQVLVEVDKNNWPALSEREQPIIWRMFVPNSPPLQGEWDFTDWCRF
jgi:hypothetical protein